MNTDERHQIWEISVKGFDILRLASDIVREAECESGKGRAFLKRKIAEGTVIEDAFLSCAHCGNPVFYVAANATQSAHLKHKHVTDELAKLKMHNCQFYTQADAVMMSEVYKGEGQWHLETKQHIAALLQKSTNVNSASIAVEKYLFDNNPEKNARRRPDITFEDIHGDRWAIELTRSWLQPEVVVQREAFFRASSINLIWLFSEECQITNQITFEYILYGSNIGERSQFNAFVYSSSAKEKSLAENTLYLEVVYPKFMPTASKSNPVIFQYEHCFCEFIVLNKAPDQRLPYWVETDSSYQNVLIQANELYETAKSQELVRQEEKLVRQKQSEIEDNKKNLRQQLEQLQIDVMNFSAARYVENAAKITRNILAIKNHPIHQEFITNNFEHCREKLREVEQQFHDKKETITRAILIKDKNVENARNEAIMFMEQLDLQSSCSSPNYISTWEIKYKRLKNTLRSYAQTDLHQALSESYDRLQYVIDELIRGKIEPWDVLNLPFKFELEYSYALKAAISAWQELKNETGAVETAVYDAAKTSIDCFAANVELQIAEYYQMELNKLDESNTEEHDVGFFKLTKLIGAANALNQFKLLYRNQRNSHQQHLYHELQTNYINRGT